MTFVSRLIVHGAWLEASMQLTLDSMDVYGDIGYAKLTAIDLEGMREINTGQEECCALLHGCAALSQS